MAEQSITWPILVMAKSRKVEERDKRAVQNQALKTNAYKA